MTNEEKSYSISNIICGTDDSIAWHAANEAAIKMAEWKDNQLSQSIMKILDTETEMLKEIAENKMAKPATREEYIKILTERVKEVMNGN